MASVWDYESCIDDSFEPVPWPDFPEEPKTALDGKREGHWEVSSSIGSFIDDRCPTIYDYPVERHAPGAVKPLAGSLLKKLAKATIDEKVATARANEHTVQERDQGAHKRVECSELEKEKPKVFRIPPVPNEKRGIKTKYKIHQQTVVRPISAEVAAPQKDSKRAAVIKARSPSPRSSVWSSTPLKKTKVVRIVGKNGEVAFVELPLLPPSYKPSVNAQKAAPSAPKPAQKAEKAEKTARIVTAKQTGAEQQIRNEPNPKPSNALPKQQKQKPPKEQKTKAATKAATAEMSGALPILPAEVVSPPVSVRSSTKDSGIFMGGMFENESESPSAIPEKVQSLARKIAKTASVQARSERSRAISAHSVQSGWQQVGAGQTTGGGIAQSDGKQSAASNYRPPTVHSEDSASTIVHDFSGMAAFAARSRAASVANKAVHQGSAKWNSPPAARFTGSDAKWNRADSTRAPSVQYRGDERAHSYHERERTASIAEGATHLRSEHHQTARSTSQVQKTVFAGTGWISPHPLSVAPSEIASPPQSEIRLPGGSGWQEGPTMTYEDWQRVKGSPASQIQGSQHQVAEYLHGWDTGSDTKAVDASWKHMPQHEGSVAGSQQWSGFRQPSSASYRHSIRSPSQQHQQQTSSRQSIHSDAPQFPQPPSARQSSQHTAVYPPPEWQDQPFVEDHQGMQYPPQLDGARSYQFGLSQEDLDAYQKQLENTISFYMSRMPQMQQRPERATATSVPPDPRSNSQYPPGAQQEQPYPGQYRSSPLFAKQLSNGQVQMKMPWDQSSRGSGSTTMHAASQQPSLRSSVSRQAKSLATNTPPSLDYGSNPPSPLVGGPRIYQRKPRSPPGTHIVSPLVPQQEDDNTRVTSGMSHWNNIYQAEQGSGGFQGSKW